MRSDGAPRPGRYLLGLLASGARPFPHRSGVARLLGLPADVGVRMATPVPLPPVGFRYEDAPLDAAGERSRPAAGGGPRARPSAGVGDATPLLSVPTQRGREGDAPLAASPQPARPRRGGPGGVPQPPVSPEPPAPPGPLASEGRPAPRLGTGPEADARTEATTHPEAGRRLDPPVPPGRPPRRVNAAPERAAPGPTPASGTGPPAPIEHGDGSDRPGGPEALRLTRAGVADPDPRVVPDPTTPAPRRPLEPRGRASMLAPPPSTASGGEPTSGRSSSARPLGLSPRPSQAAGAPFRPRPRAADDLGHLRDAVATLASRPRRSEPEVPPAAPAPPPASPPVVVVRSGGSTSRRAPRALWARSVLRHTHLRMLR